MEHTLNLQNQTIIINKNMIVNRLGFGTMRLTGPGIWGYPTDRNKAITILRRAIELGVNFIDTADSYGPDVSESLIAEALYPYPQDLVIATKGGMVRPGSNQWVINGKPEHLRTACEGSLRRLKAEQIVLYQLHRIDPKIPLTDQIGVLKDLQTEGKIKHIGLSEVNLDQLRQIHNMLPIASVQNKFSLLRRQSEDVLDYCTTENITFIPWAPLSIDLLTTVGPLLNSISQKMNATPTQIALAWLLQKSNVILPSPGTTNLSHLEENVGAAHLTLDGDSIDALNNINSPEIVS